MCTENYKTEIQIVDANFLHHIGGVGIKRNQNNANIV